MKNIELRNLFIAFLWGGYTVGYAMILEEFGFNIPTLIFGLVLATMMILFSLLQVWIWR